ncbi:M23 family metallopeptidase [Solemya velesiana gill symbiont]|uniref:M23 family metallopeptidase n=1 Tax=Solemya velesiana gill symbiont TaxID=1918948 RepID=UPI001FED1EA8|nr:peptidoglycan DD-metalloendopeptidase family protein [Solemya velesiana gill symbiont]
MFATVVGTSLWAGYELGQQTRLANSESERANRILHDMIRQQQTDLEETRAASREHIDALALRLGEMQSHILRIDALGERLAIIGKLDTGEFDFSESPARGGLDASETAQSVEAGELVAEIEGLARTLDDREHKLELLEEMLLGIELQKQTTPAGRPVKKGWISSRYGYRKDPFTGKNAFHHGVDIAGKKDSDVFAVASGVVTFAGEQSGYGYLVEIRHADGYATKYGHNSKIFVEAGDLVTKGQVIGSLGSTGRSTGPHVHFEIVRNGKTLNPSKYLRKIN